MRRCPSIAAVYAARRTWYALACLSTRETYVRFLRFPRTFMGWVQATTGLVAWGIILGMAADVVAPAFRELRLYGVHDWDPMELYRYLVYKTMVRFHQFPFWNPYTCGGHPVWGGSESDSTIVSPFFPFYLALKLPVAMRVELLGSALLSVVGTWLFAGRLTSSPAVRAFVVVLFAVNSRWAMQASVGHVWHLAYEWTPWALYFLDGAFVLSTASKFPGRNIAWAGASLAMMVYTGGIYPLPQTVVVIGLYATAYSIIVRDWRPLFCAVAAGVVSFGLSAPKLLPTLDLFGRFPRYTESPEALDFDLLVSLLTSPDPRPTPFWGWHEWGMYIGTIPLLVLVVGMAFAQGERVRALRWSALSLLALGWGSFHPFAPWSLLHQVSLFRSQHVPSRWLYPALLMAAVVTAATLERLMSRARGGRPWLEIAGIVAVAWVAYDVSQVARAPLLHTFEKEPPRAHESMGEFHTEDHLPPDMGYASGEWAPAALPAALANIGTIDCSTFFGFHSWYRDHNGHTPGLGAKGKGDAAYHGEVYVAEGRGSASIERWSPNEVAVRVDGARRGDHLILNQNWDPGWRANGAAVLDWADLPAATLSSPDERVVFRYVPRTFWVAMAIFVATVGGLAWTARAARRVRTVARREVISARSL